MSFVRNISQILRVSSVYKSPVSWTRVMSSSTPATTKPEEPKPTSKPTADETIRNRASHKPTNLEKKFLVWTGKYKTVEEIPEYVK